MSDTWGWRGRSGDRDLPLILTWVLIGVLALAAVGTVRWAGEHHGTHCTYDQFGQPVNGVDVSPFLDPIVAGCLAAAAVLTVVLLYLSRRRREFRGAEKVRVGYPSVTVALLTAWCAVVYAISVFGSAKMQSRSPLVLLPAYLLAIVGVATIIAQYALLVPAPILMAIALTRQSRDRAYAVTQFAIFYALLGCIAVAVGSVLLLTGFCIGHD